MGINKSYINVSLDTDTYSLLQKQVLNLKLNGEKISYVGYIRKLLEEKEQPEKQLNKPEDFNNPSF